MDGTTDTAHCAFLHVPKKLHCMNHRPHSMRRLPLARKSSLLVFSESSLPNLYLRSSNSRGVDYPTPRMPC